MVVNRTLGLMATGREQDWEIEFADSKRLNLMLDVLEEGFLDFDAQSALCLLIVASFEEGFDAGNENSDQTKRAAQLIAANPNVLERMRFYWMNLKRSNHPILIKRLLNLD